MAPSSSAKKVARLAQRGKGKRVRFQGGTLFPAAVVLVILLGLVLIVYGRQSRPSTGNSPPTVNDHWHAAFGIDACDDSDTGKGQLQWQPKLVGNKEETKGTDAATGQPVYVNKLFGTVGVHSHDDGVIHWHPFSTKAVGNRAKLGVFLDVYGIKLTDGELTLPSDQGGKSWKEGTTKCDGKDADLSVVVWNSFSDTGEGTTYQASFGDIRLKQDGMVFAVVFAPKGTKVTMPPWAARLPELGTADGSSTGQTTTTVAGADTSTTSGSTDTSSTVTSSTVTGGSAPSGSDTTSTTSTPVAASSTSAG